MKKSTLSNAEAMAFAKNVKAFQEREDLSNKDLAELLGVTAQYIYVLRSGKGKPSDKLIAEFGRLSKMSKKQLLTDPEEAVWAERRAFGRRCRKARLDAGYSMQQVCGFVGLYNSRILDEIEDGKCSTTAEEREKLEKLLFPKVKVEKAPAPAPAAETPVETEEVKAETDSANTNGDLPYEVVEVIVNHVKDLKVSEEIQRKVFRTFSEYITSLKEEALFGK